MEKFARQCSECGKGMNSGFVVDGGNDYYCSEDCLHKHISPKEWEEIATDDNEYNYWTEWESGDCMDE